VATEPTKIILDTDVGHDDVVAWALVQASPELKLLGVTTVFGNTALERVWRNAKHTKLALGSQVPLFLGASEPLLRDRIHAESAHGESGLAGVTMPASTPILEPHGAVGFIIETVLSQPGQVTLVALGPLTNLALAIRLEPRIVSAIKGISLMGGGLNGGNITPAAEFNTLADPHAARIVFESGIPIQMFGFNITQEVFVMPTDLERVKSWGTKAGTFLTSVLQHSLDSHLSWGYPGASMHDPCPVVHLLRPNLFSMQTMNVHVETQPGHNFGRTTGDTGHQRLPEHDVDVAINADRRGVIEFILDRLETLG
jgi:purine nucleosidase